MNRTLSAARRLKEFFGDIDAVCEALEKLGKQEQIERESEAAVVASRREHTGLSEHMTQLKENVKAEAARLLALKDEADKAKELLLAETSVKSKEIISATQKQVSEILAEATAKRKAIDKEVADTRETLDAVKREIHLSKAELQAVRGELAKLRDRITA